MAFGAFPLIYSYDLKWDFENLKSKISQVEQFEMKSDFWGVTLAGSGSVSTFPHNSNRVLNEEEGRSRTRGRGTYKYGFSLSTKWDVL